MNFYVIQKKIVIVLNAVITKFFYSNICTVYSKNNTDNINSLNYAFTQSESKEILHNLIDGNDYELTVEVEEDYFSNIFIKIMIYLLILIINKM